MFFSLLGPFEVRRADGAAVAVGGPRVRNLLALLLLETGHVVPVHRLVDGMYGERPPAGVTNALQSQVSRLRRGLADDLGAGGAVEFHPGGYRLTVDPETVDAHRFERLAADGRAGLIRGDHRTASRLLAEAVALWRGPALADLPHAAARAVRLEELRTAAHEDHAEALLALGAAREALPDLRALVAAHPLRERPRSQLMRALYAAGRGADALEVFEEGRRLLAGELGTDPSAELAAVHRAILRGDPDPMTAVPAATGWATAAGPPGPAVSPSPAVPPALDRGPAAPGPTSSPRQANALAAYGDSGGPAAPSHPGGHRDGVTPNPRTAPSPRGGTTPAAPAEGAESAAVPAPRALPSPLTSFVGRAGELARIAELTASARLVTLVGPGGTGKTRLATEAAARAGGEVCLAELAPVTDGAGVAHAVAAALGIRDAGGLLPVPGGAVGDPVERLVTVLSHRAVLMVLDNCEHVVEDAARLAHHLLLACPGLRILATSREPLAITGETVLPVPQLPLPPQPDEPPAGHAAPTAAGPAPATGDGAAARAEAYARVVRRAPAVRLFADRAAAASPGFTVDAATAPAVARVCAALDGLPLAIELAAARLRTLTPAEIAERLDDRFRLLSRGSRTAAPRHRTLDAVVRWSWDLLGDPERTLARRLTVFVGGATAAAVAAVCGLHEDDADELLAGLAEKSLVTVDHGPGGARYRMLETVRAFGALRLADAGEEESVRRAHAEYFTRLAMEADALLRGPGQLDALARLAAEKGNTLAALRWATGADHPLALRLHAALTWSWWLGGNRGECGPRSLDLLGAVGARPPRGPDGALDPGLDEEYALCALNALAAHTGAPGAPVGPFAGTEALLDTTAGVLAAIRRPLRHPALIVQWALTGGPDAADPHAHAHHLGDDRWSHAITHLGQGHTALFRGDADAAAEHLAQATTDLRAVGDLWGLANALDPLAQLAAWAGDHDRARALLDEAIGMAERLGAVEDTCDLLCRCGDLAIATGRTRDAHEDFTRAEGLARRAGIPAKVRAALRGHGDVARLNGEHASAARLYRQALYGAAGDPATVLGGGAAWFQETFVQAEAGLGLIAEAERDPATAVRHHLAALRHARECPGRPTATAAAVVERLAALAVAEGDGVRAAALLGAAAVLRGARPPGPDTPGTEAGARALAGEASYEAAFETARQRTAALPAGEALTVAEDIAATG